MSKRWIKAGATSQTIDIFVLDSSSTIGAGLTGLVFNTAGLTCYFRKGALGTPTAVALATLALVTTAWATGGFIAVDATYMPGVYRLDIPDVVIDTAGMVTMYLRGATNMAPVVLELEIVAVDIYDTVRLGLTALPNTAVTTNGSLITAGTGTAQLSVASGLVTLAGVTHTNAVIPTVTTVSGNVNGNVAGSVGSVTSAVTVGTINANVITASSIDTDAITAAKIATDAIDADALAMDAVTEIADGILARDIGSGTNALTTLNERTVRSALRAVRNKSSIATSTLTVTTENDTTTAWTAAVSSSASADPVTGVDPD